MKLKCFLLFKLLTLYNCYYEKIGNSEPIKLKDLPFDIPDNWTWARQKDICWLENGKKSSGMKLPYLEAKVIRGFKEPIILKEGIVVDPRNRIILVDGENSGEIMVPPYKGYMGSTFKIFSSTVFFNYEYLSFIFSLNRNLYKNSKVGAAIPHLNKSIFKESLIAVPPLNEQKRIVDKINSLESLLKDYGAIENKLTLLESEFPDKLKKSILEYAIQGKLVKQDPNDEPASVLLDRIKAEKEKLIKEGKIKRDKNESYIYQGDDKNYYEKVGKDINKIEVPFDIPDNWTWARINNIANTSSGGTPDRGISNYWNGNIPWLKISDITSSDKYVTKASECITEDGIKNSSAKIMSKGTILYTIFATIGEVRILNFCAACNQAIVGLNTYLKCIDEYLYLFLVNLQDYMKSISKGCAQFNINQKILRDSIVAIPPLNEQKRITNKVILVNQILSS